MNKWYRDSRVKYAVIIDFRLNFSVLASSNSRLVIYILGVDILLSEV